ncbi:MAG: hypothetical protein HY740_04140 [Chloroflexi bacterium]|nr:hypothetical protein [Chloroflexota bacterium]
MTSFSLKRIQRFPYEGIALDLIMIAFTQIQPPLQMWVAQNLLWAFWLTGAVQCVGLACALRGQGSWDEEPRGVMKFVVQFAPLFWILAAGGFMWLFLPALAIDTQIGWLTFTVQFFIVLFGGVLAVGLSMESSGEPLTFKRRVLTALGTLIYLAFSEAVIAACAATGNVGAGEAFFALFISYLPIRMTLAIRPPWSFSEVVSAVAAFMYVAAYFFR